MTDNPQFSPGDFSEERLSRIPREPGVYMMKDRSNKVIYVGKAMNLRNRIRSYFRGGDGRPTVQFLLARVRDIETIVTQTDKEAFLLENTLIKKYKPRYNLRLQSDITYLSLRIDPRLDFPRFEVVRKRKRDGAIYLGPYDCGRSARTTLQFIHRFIPLRQCTDSVMGNRTRPCILYDIGRCCAPCCLPVSKTDYAQLVNQAILLLKGNRDDMVKALTERMMEHSRRMEFEKAAELRDKIAAVHHTVERQRVALAPDFDADALAHYTENGHICFALLIYRNGLLNDMRCYFDNDSGLPIDEIYNTFISQYYDDSHSIPPLILTAEKPAEAPMLKAWLEDLRGMNCEVRRPQRGEMARIVDIARQNSEEQLKKRLSRADATQEGLNDLQRRLRLPNPPSKIECFDISTFQGKSTVASRIVFLDGAPCKDEYRKYKIKTVEGTDDFAAMAEVLTRRFRRVAEGEDEAPDLVILDGGIGQLAVAVAVFEDLGIVNVAVAGLAKSRLKSVDDEKRRARLEAEGAVKGEEDDMRTAERLFLPGQKNPILLKRNHPSLYLVQRIRDEAHRFAITYHKKLRAATTVTSSLDAIAGVGPTRRKGLLRHFGSLAALRLATMEEIENAPGISKNLASVIYSALHNNNPPKQE